MKLDVEFPYKEMYEEILPFLDNFKEHRQNVGRGWKSLVLHGAGVYATTSTETNLFELGGKLHWTRMANLCEIAYNFFDKIWPLENHRRIRWMLLEPGGYIGEHVDSTDNMLGDAVNFSLNHPEGCDFYLGGKIIPWKPGEARLMNLTNKHKVINNSNERRIHMIYHGSNIRINRTTRWAIYNDPFIVSDLDHAYIKLVIRSYEKYKGY